MPAKEIRPLAHILSQLQDMAKITPKPKDPTPPAVTNEESLTQPSPFAVAEAEPPKRGTLMGEQRMTAQILDDIEILVAACETKVRGHAAEATSLELPEDPSLSELVHHNQTRLAAIARRLQLFRERL